jgi:Protein of unknown function (DUF3237)
MTPQLETRYVFTITARIGEVTSAGEIGTGVRRIIPITGGEVRGEQVNGKVLPFGADFQIIRPNELIELEAKYALGPALRPGRAVAKTQARRTGRSQTDLFPHRPEIRDWQ